MLSVKQYNNQREHVIHSNPVSEFRTLFELSLCTEVHANELHMREWVWSCTHELYNIFIQSSSKVSYSKVQVCHSDYSIVSWLTKAIGCSTTALHTFYMWFLRLRVTVAN